MSVFSEIEIVGRYTLTKLGGKVESLWVSDSTFVRIKLGQLVRSNGYTTTPRGTLEIVVKIRNPGTFTAPIWGIQSRCGSKGMSVVCPCNLKLSICIRLLGARPRRVPLLLYRT